MSARRTRLRLLAIGFVTVAVLVTLTLGVPPRLSLSRSELRDYETLIRADMFAGPAVGFGGVTPDAVSALRRLARSRHGSTAFRYVLLRGSMPGKLYALVGLRRTSPVTFHIAVQPFRVTPGYVGTMFGCILGGEPIRDIVAGPATDDGVNVRLERGETLDQWWRRTRPNGEVHVDIVGGGYTSMFLDPPSRRWI